MRQARNTEKYSYDILNNQQRRVAEGTISVALTGNISAYKEPTLFDELPEEQVTKLREIDEKYLINREGKAVSLTRKQTKIIYALSVFMSQSKEEDEIREYVKKLNSGSNPNSKISLPISITALTKLVEVDGKARARQKEGVYEELQALSEIRQVQDFKTNQKGEKVRFSSPFIMLGERIEDLSEDKHLNADFVNIVFGSIFFYELYTKFAVIKPSLFRIWGRAGSGTDTELFNILLADLLSKYSFHRIAAIKAVNSLKKGAYKTDESYYKAKNVVQKKALTYSEYTYNIRRRINTDYESTRKQRKDFRIHLQNAIKALKKEVGIITEATFTQTAKGERVDFVFNIDYDKNEVGESVLLAQGSDSLPLLEAPKE